MSSFKEFLEDYEEKELESQKKFIKRLKDGKISPDETYPKKNRFEKIKEPLARPPLKNPIWNVIPFYGSTIVALSPRQSKKDFDRLCKTANLGFDSNDVDRIIDFVKNTGRLQIDLDNYPTSYKELEFLEPLIVELNPPVRLRPLKALIDKKTQNEYYITFDTLVKMGFLDYVGRMCNLVGADKRFTLNDIFNSYCTLKYLGYESLIEDIEFFLLTNPTLAHTLLADFNHLVGLPAIDPLPSIYTYSIDEIKHRTNFSYNTKEKIIPYDIGKFILKNLVNYPETMDGCMNLIQVYDESEMYKVLNAVNEGVRKENIDIIQGKSENLKLILENIWSDANKIKKYTKVTKLEIALLGGLSAYLNGVGVLAGLGYLVADKIVGVNLDSISERFTKNFSPNHLVTIFDFKKDHNLK